MQPASKAEVLAPRTGEPMPYRAAMVDFYLYSTHEVAVWEPLWRSLRQHGVDAQFILEPPGTHRAMGSIPDETDNWHDDKEGPIVPLVDDATFATIAEILSRHSLPFLEKSRLHADAAVTTQGIGWLLPYRDALRIRTEYGACAFVDVYGHGPTNKDHDAVLAHGQFSASAISAHVASSNIHQVGYPKWAPELRATAANGDATSEAREQLGIDTELPVLAWLPTWAHNSGIDRYADVLAGLADDYLIVAKPHHNSLRFEASRLAAIDSRIQVLADLHSLVPLLRAADVVVADSRSGFLAETFLADRPVVGLLPGVDARSNGVVAGLEDTVVWCQKPEQLAGALTSALSVDRSTARGRWRDWFFADHDGQDDHVAARKIIELIETRKLHSTAKLRPRDLDDLIEATPPTSPDTVVATFSEAWPLWPGHPRLLELVARALPVLELTDVEACARMIRAAGLIDHCPIRMLSETIELDAVRRLTAAAIGAITFEDELSSGRFHTLVSLVDEADFDDALLSLDIVPSAIPVFIHEAATSASRCRRLAEALDRLGATEEAAVLASYGETLVSAQ